MTNKPTPLSRVSRLRAENARLRARVASLEDAANQLAWIQEDPENICKLISFGSLEADPDFIYPPGEWAAAIKAARDRIEPEPDAAQVSESFLDLVNNRIDESRARLARFFGTSGLYSAAAERPTHATGAAIEQMLRNNTLSRANQTTTDTFPNQ